MGMEAAGLRDGHQGCPNSCVKNRNGVRERVREEGRGVVSLWEASLQRHRSGGSVEGTPDGLAS